MRLGLGSPCLMHHVLSAEGESIRSTREYLIAQNTVDSYGRPCSPVELVSAMLMLICIGYTGSFPGVTV
jgi:hypothetical protein